MNCFLVDMSVNIHYRWQQTQSTEWRANNSSTCLYFYWGWWRTYGCPFCLPSRITLVNGTPTYMLTFRPFIRENGQVPGPNLIVWNRKKKNSPSSCCWWKCQFGRKSQSSVTYLLSWTLIYPLYSSMEDSDWELVLLLLESFQSTLVPVLQVLHCSEQSTLNSWW